MGNVDKLESAGIKLDDMNEGLKKVFSELSDEEVDTLVRIKGRIDSAGEVGGLAMAADGDGIFYH